MHSNRLMWTLFVGVLVIAATSLPASAARDEGTPAVGGPVQVDSDLVLVDASLVDDVGGQDGTTLIPRALRAVGVNACGATVTNTIGTCTTANCATFSALQRPFRNGVASTCAATKACPGANAGGPFVYNVYQYDITDCTCVTVSLNQGTCTGAAIVHADAFLGAVTPFATYPANCVTNPGVSFLGDVGSSVTQPFSFEVPAQATPAQILSIVINSNFTPFTPCQFSFTVSCGPASGLACMFRGLKAELAELNCEIIRLLNTPDGRREACSSTVQSLCGTGYSWNSVSTGGPQPDCPTP